MLLRTLIGVIDTEDERQTEVITILFFLSGVSFAFVSALPFDSQFKKSYGFLSYALFKE